jgi:hypothetical protein
MQGSEHAESVERQNYGETLACSLRRNPGLTPRKAEDLSYGRLMTLSRETLYDFLKLLRQTMEAMKLHQRLYLIYNVDDTGLKMIYNSGNQKLLAVKGNKRFTVLLAEEKEKP